MTLLRRPIVLFLVAAAVSSGGRAQSPAAALFQEALTLERAEGRLQDAIFRYERVVAEFPADRDVVPRALYQLALAYERLGNPRATLMLTRLVTDYATASPYAADARRKLAAAQTTFTGPFPTQSLNADFELGSPDGRAVLYRRNRTDTGRVYLRNLATGAERAIVDLEGTASNFAWSPDSQHLAFNFQHAPTQTHEIRIISVATGESRTLAARGYPSAWTTRDELFVYRPNYASNTVDWSFVPVAGGEPRKVAARAVGESGLGTITPDGRAVVVTQSKRLVLVDLATGDERPITTGSAEETRPVMSPDGRLLAFASNPDGKWAIYVAPLDRVPVRAPVRIAYIDQPGLVLVRYGYRDWWTDDGLLTMAFGYADSNIYRIAMNRATGRAVDSPERLTQDAPHNTQPAVAPDGRSIAYYARSGSKGGIAVMDVSGVNERPLIEQNGTLPISWRAPAEILFYNFATAAGQKPAITSFNIITGEQQPVAQVEGLYWTYVPARQEILHHYPGGGGPKPGAVLKAYSLADRRDRTVATIDYLGPWLAVSPDGRTIAYVVFPSGSTMGSCELALMSVEGVQEKVLRSRQESCMGPVAWSPDGKYLLADAQAGPHVMAVATGESWPLLGDSTDRADWRAGSWASGGSFVLLTRSANRVERTGWAGVTYEAVVKLIGRPEPEPLQFQPLPSTSRWRSTITER